MLLTMFLLGLLYVVFIGVLIAVGAGAGIIVIVALVMLGGQLFASRDLRCLRSGGGLLPSLYPRPHRHSQYRSGRRSVGLRDRYRVLG